MGSQTNPALEKSRRTRVSSIDGKSDERKIVAFTYNGKPVTGYEGEPIAAALMAAGISVTGKNIRGEPRGYYCGMGYCFECRVVINGVRNQRSCIAPVRAGLNVQSQDDSDAESEERAHD